MKDTILEQLRGISRHEAVKALVAALVEITAEMPAADLPGVVAAASQALPVKKRPHDPYTPVWEYLKTVPAYDTVITLRAELIERFGEENVPSLSHLYRHLKRGGKP